MGCNGCGGNKNPIPASAYLYASAAKDFSEDDGRKPVSRLKARVHPNGVIEFPHKGTPPTLADIGNLEGYVQNPHNLFQFRPTAKDCVHRLSQQYVRANGALEIYDTCRCAECPLYNKRVTYVNCNLCAFRTHPAEALPHPEKSEAQVPVEQTDSPAEQSEPHA